MYRDKVENNKKKIQNILFVWGFVLITLIATTAAGANASTGEPAQIIEKFEVEEDFGVRKALAMLASLCDKNIVPSPNVDGVLAFRSLKNVTFEEAMDAILGENFKYEQEGKLIKIYTKDEYKRIKEDPDRMTYKVFTLYYITAQEAQTLVTPVLSGVGNAKIAASTAAETEISGGGSSSGGGSLDSGGGGDSMALHDTIVVYDFPENIEKAAQVIKVLDIRPKQVLVEVTILSALLTEGMEFGVDLNLLGGVALEGTDVQAADAFNPAVSEQTVMEQVAAGAFPGSALETSGFAAVGTSGLRIGVRSGDVTAFITALESVTDVTVLANPKILAVNKQEGSVLIGAKTGYRSQVTQTDGGTTTEKVEFLETGTQLVFRPYIGNDGYIRMDIYPKDSSLTPGSDPPEEITAELKTNIIVRDGETIVIGGLFRDSVRTERSQIPLLGDLPLIGGLFRGTNDLTQRQEVIILLTVHIIDGAGQTDGDARADDIRRKRFGAKDELQWIGRARLAEDRYAKAAKFYIEGNNESAMKQLKVALTLRPSYLEAIRLKERILAESSPEEAQNIERIMLEAVESEDTAKWLRK